jgi:HEAT repeat protein
MQKYFESRKIYGSYLEARGANEPPHEADLTEPEAPIAPGEAEAQRRMNAATEAILQIGPKAIPYLLDWMENEKETSSVRGWRAVEVFQWLAPATEEAIPHLTKLLNNPTRDVRDRAEACLAAMGAKGLPPLLAALADTARPNRDMLIYSIGMMRTEAIPAVPALIRAMRDPNPAVVDSSYWALLEIAPRGEIVVPALIDIVADPKLRSESAINFLAMLGYWARSAAPALEQALNDPNPKISSAATNALKRIAKS